MANLTLYSFFRSSSSWRVRIALALKGLEYDYKPVDILNGQQRSDEYLKLNPMGSVPTLIHNGNKLTQSLAILEYLDELYPDPPLLPKNDPIKRCKVRGLSLLIATDIQPLQNIRVMRYIGESKFKFATWAVENGLTALEHSLQETAGRYSYGNDITLADICLVPQIAHAIDRFYIDIKKYRTVSRINDELKSHESFLKAHPENQPDYPNRFQV